ncbi:hypothetical protein NLI96_g11733 [Meripilus lineatus]|uniref:Uncharacterized protein n=1 Tax=Meripilus lineatus TaxID=2056292 RepID=A0AAD5YAK5_9APHY|nr:hypothetical protein NLI96_g11733 [Physisporinus lineatus]
MPKLLRRVYYQARMHASLAFVHEHQVPERPKHFLFHQTKVDKYYREELGMSEEDIKINITNTYQPETFENYSPFDPHSITLYQFPGHLIQNGRGTPFNTDLSDIDKTVLMLNYARLDIDPLVSRWSVSYAADVIGIKGEWREKIVVATHPHDVLLEAQRVAFICFALHCDQMYVDLPFGRIWVYTAKRLEHLRAEGSEIISELE